MAYCCFGRLQVESLKRQAFNADKESRDEHLFPNLLYSIKKTPLTENHVSFGAGMGVRTPTHLCIRT